MPLIYTQAHFFMFDLPLTAATAAIALALTDEGVFSSRKKAALFGLLLGAAMLIKWTFFIYALAPYAVRLVEERQNSKKSGAGVLLHLSVMALIAAPWYLYNFYPIISKLLMYSFSRGELEGLPSVFSWASLSYYISMLPAKAGLIALLPALSGAVVAVARRDREGLKILAFFLVPIAIMTLLQNKKDRYIMPAMPFMALLAAYALAWLKSRKAVIAVSMSAAALSFAALCVAVLPLDLSWPNSARPKKEDWKIAEFMSKTEKGGFLAVVPDHPRMNNINYSFYSEHVVQKASITGIFNFPMSADYFLVKTGSQGPAFSGSEKRKKITEDALKGAGPAAYYYRIHEAVLPDSDTAVLFKRKERIITDPAAFSSSVNANVMAALSLYMKEAKNFRFRVSVEEGTALIKSLRISFSSALLGDFRHKPAGLEVRNGDIEAFNILLDPAELAAGRLSLISAGGIRIHSLETDEAALEKFASYYLKAGQKASVRIKDGAVEAEVFVKPIKAAVTLELYRTAGETADIGFKVKKIKAGFLSLPAFIVNAALKDYNPLLNRSKAPIRLEFRELSLRDGKLKVKN